MCFNIKHSFPTFIWLNLEFVLILPTLISPTPIDLISMLDFITSNWFIPDFFSLPTCFTYICIYKKINRAKRLCALLSRVWFLTYPPVILPRAYSVSQVRVISLQANELLKRPQTPLLTKWYERLSRMYFLDENDLVTYWLTISRFTLLLSPSLF